MIELTEIYKQFEWTYGNMIENNVWYGSEWLEKKKQTNTKHGYFLIFSCTKIKIWRKTHNALEKDIITMNSGLRSR